MPAWEYTTVNLYELPLATQASDALNEVGKEGWELVAITSNGMAYFKRSTDTKAPRAGSLCG
jgi:Domain of unknown function (DUF4177)